MVRFGSVPAGTFVQLLIRSQNSSGRFVRSLFDPERHLASWVRYDHGSTMVVLSSLSSCPSLVQIAVISEYMSGSHWRSTSLFPILDIMLHCTDMFSHSSKSVPKSVFCYQPIMGGKCLGEFGVGPNFLNSSQVWLRCVQWFQRLGVKKEKK